MANAIDDLIEIERECCLLSEVFERGELGDITQRLLTACDVLEDAWCGSWLGYHASVYKVGLEPRAAGEHFDPEWGATGFFSNRTSGDWAEFKYEAVEDKILELAGRPETEPITATAKRLEDAFKRSKQEAVPMLAAVLRKHADERLQKILDEIEKLESHVSANLLLRALMPKHYMSRDSLAMHQGPRAPHHLAYKAWLLEERSYAKQLGQLGDLAGGARRYLERTFDMAGTVPGRTDGKVFIGHGRSLEWMKLQDFLERKLEIGVEEYDREETAGVSRKERLLAMLNSSCMAFLVMTAEDQHKDETWHARANVIHEVGLFQGRYGFERAIVLLEEGCEEFSNLAGTGEIRFPPGKLESGFERVRDVLKREGIG